MKSYSLKWRLVSTLLMVFILLWSLVFCWLYYDLQKQLQLTLDERLSASAHMVARLIRHLPVHDLPNVLESVNAENANPNLIACEVSFFSSHISTAQKVIARTQDAPDNLSNQSSGFSTWTHHGTEWRSYTLKKGQIQVVSAEKLQLRSTLLAQILKSVLIPLIFTLILCVFLILWIIRVEFQPLDQIAQHVTQKKQNLSEAASYLSALKTQNIPTEIQPFVDSLIELIHNLHESLENEKSFSAFAAHELRSPLTAIKTNVQLSLLMLQQSGQQQSKLAQNLQQADHSIQRYQQLLEQLLLLSKTELHPIQSHENTLIADILKQVIQELSLKYALESTYLQIQWNTLTSLQLPASSLHIILKNLLENIYLHAQSYTVIDIYMRNNHLIIQDNGIGLNDTELQLLTKRFWRKSAQNTGYGLGLALVNVLLNKNGYAIHFQHHQPHGLKVMISKIEN
ncbi:MULTISPECIES: ATP-binding protein [unclassified Acinetobacter]|uniref:ATP-binding protein n=1 Tax=unclassified Acinetobacter TaxID=196816 RepID=UPI002575360B|nr:MULTISPECIES: ATP-binding protein [unclassified Acinetobacter]MDM1757128.1 sensor histidine kinase N-terminal domain-containing protein [Acinetobacter sp. 256-1]MDM1760089.1 sensor histidine kinase N-terminal domain-containing protein [Acinetobacter sp. 251-1]